VRAERPFGPGELLAYLNERIVGRLADAPTFVTAFCGVYDPERRLLRHSSAGHHPPRLKRCSDGSLFSLPGMGLPPLGVLPRIEPAEAENELVAGDQVVFYTDGIVEAMDPGGEMFGLERLDGVLENCGINAHALIETVLAELQSFTSGRELSDDVTMLVARVTG
jgi:sigma-B regulation protein RsbU (phosphoserine phosphatase)